MHRYVNVEFCGGPWDGDVAIFGFPPPPEYHLALMPRLISASIPELTVDPPRVGVYRFTDLQSYEVLAIPDEMLDQARIKTDAAVVLGHLMRDKRAMHCTWQGEG